MRLRPGRFAGIIAATSTLLAASAGAQETPATPANAPAAASPQASSKNSEQIETVVVTATKRKEDVNKVPISVSVLNGEDLASQHIVSVEDLTRSVPNISFSGGASGNGPGLSNIEMRGIASSAGAGTVGIYMDDISMTTNNLYSLGSPEPKFFDVDRIEVLRGPQGTLYGSSSMGGTIKYLMNQPNLNSFDDTVYLEGSHTDHGGNNGTVNGVVNVPVIPGELAMRLGVQFTHDSGYIKQLDPTTLNVIDSGTNTEQDKVLHLAFKWQPTKNLTITPSLFYQQVLAGDSGNEYITESAYQNNSNPLPLPPYSTTRAVLETGDDRLFTPNLTVNYDAGFADVVSVTSYYERNFARVQDGSMYNSAFVAAYISSPALAQAVGDLPSQAILQNQIRQFSQEVRLTSKPYDPAGSNPWTWVAGAYASDLHTTVNENDPIPGINATFANYGASISNPATSPLGGAFPGDFPNDDAYFSDRHYLTTQGAIFGEANYHFTSALQATVGVRDLYASSQLAREGGYWETGLPLLSESTQTPDPVSSHAITPKFAVTWNVDSTDMLYANIAKGFRLGNGVRAVPVSLCGGPSTPNNTTLSAFGLTSAPTSYGPDSLWSYEVGDKSRFFDNRLAINTSLYYINWNNIQVDNAELTCGFDFETNGGRAISNGVEVEIKGKPTRDLVLGLSGGYANAYYVNAIPALASAAGQDVVGVPHFNATLSADYHFELAEHDGFARISSHWVGNSYGAAANVGASAVDYRRPSYNLVEASTGLTFDKWEVSLFVKNLLNNQQVIQHPDVQTFEEAYQLAPRIIGLSLSGKI